MRRALILAIAFLTVLGGLARCGDSAKERFLAAEALAGEKLSSRPTPAQITREPEEDLIKKGFVRIGEISLDEITGTFWGQDKPGQAPPAPDLTVPLLRRAADRGGDLVVLSRDNSLDSYQVTKRGKVLTWARQSRTEYYQQKSGTGDAGYQASRTVYYSVPTSWDMIKGVEFAVRSTGTVWRRDPELAQRLGSQTEAERRARLEKKKAIDEIDRQALLLLGEAERQAGAERQIAGLHDAVRADAVENVRALLAQGLDVNSRDPGGATPLHAAAAGRAKDAAELLVAQGADVNAKDNAGYLPLHYAALADAPGIAELLIAHGAGVDRSAPDGSTAMHMAASVGAGEAALALLAKGADVKAKTLDGATPLHLAALANASFVAELLLANGADVNAKTDQAKTPLHAAAFRNSLEVADLLLAKGADPNAQDSAGLTPLAVAVKRGFGAMAERLRAKGAK